MTEQDAFARRVLRRETHVSRSVSTVVAMLLLLVVAAAAVFAAVLVFLDQRVLGIDPRDVVDTAVAAPRGLDPTVVVGVGAVVAVIGLVLLAKGVLPGRRPRHTMPSGRLAVVVDDEVLASAAARAARTATRLGPAAGVDVPAVAAKDAVDREFAEIDVVPAVHARVRVQPTGRVDG
jgi:hypothetical protein